MRSVAFGIFTKLPPRTPVALCHWNDKLPLSGELAVTDNVTVSSTFAVMDWGCWVMRGIWAWVRQSLPFTFIFAFPLSLSVLPVST